jgi:2-polyprenyl-6-hydroxyphenyl methylase/3-demethylubiquinone-9 3-methyltransferase
MRRRERVGFTHPSCRQDFERMLRPLDAPSLKNVSTHFAFGRNWASYADLIDDRRIEEAKDALVRLLGRRTLVDKTFLDIGCGSGLHAVAAAHLGASRIVAVDIDPAAVATTRRVLPRHAPNASFEAHELSVFDLTPETYGRFAVVYSWGVLHHSGAMREAMEIAARVVEPGGLFAFALYHRTRMCGLWTWEKRWYSGASPRLQGLARKLHVALLRLRFRLTGRDFRSYVADYKSLRGMDFAHDVHDWLGGYPYESISAPEVETIMRGLGFAHVRSFTTPVTIGLFGSGCDEYVYRRTG